MPDSENDLFLEVSCIWQQQYVQQKSLMKLWRIMKVGLLAESNVVLLKFNTYFIVPFYSIDGGDLMSSNHICDILDAAVNLIKVVIEVISDGEK